MKLLILIIICSYNAYCAKILIIMPTPSYSHQIVFQPLWKELSKNHEVTLLTTNIMTDNSSTNLRQINLYHEAYIPWRRDINKLIDEYNTFKLKSFFGYAKLMNEIVNNELDNPQVKALIRESEQFDLVIAELLHPTMLAFGHRFNCPIIGVSPMDIPLFNHQLLGNPASPALYPDTILLPYDSKMNFLERMDSLLSYIMNYFFFKLYLYPNEDKTVQKHFGEDYPKLEDLARNISFVFLNTNPILHDVRPLQHNVFEIGGSLFTLEPLPFELQQFLDGQEPVIYFSLGTNVKNSNLKQIKTLEELFSKVKYKVLWKISKHERRISNTSKIFAAEWFPQRAILAHPNIKVFITQGGLQSIEESVYFGVPIVAIPFYVDQFANVRRLERKNACIVLNFKTFAAEDLDRAVNTVLENEDYKKRIQRFSNLIKDQPVDRLKIATYWIEYVLKFKKTNLIKSTIIDLPIYQYYLLDVILIVLFVLIVLIWIQLLCVRFIIKIIRSYYVQDKSLKVE